jgi:hypothetical protein
MAYTPVFSQGVKFIKIARIDDQGKDNTLSLQELNSIRIDYSNTGIVEYPITSISKYDDYFLFGVAPTNVTSSTDNQILNYRASGSSKTTVAGGNDIAVTNYTESYDNLGYFNTSSGQYVLGNQTNIPIQFITSASVTGSASGGVTIQIYSNIGGVVASQTETLGSSPWKQNLSASYSGTAQEGEQFYINVINSSVSSISYTGSFYVTQSVVPTSSISDLVVLQPYIDEDFFASDYNVLAGNALEPRVNSFYMDVDYSVGIITASNQQAILSGSATRAAVQESNYTTAAIINSRYIGKELNSAKFNEWTVGDISYGLTPNVSNPEVNFVSFNTLGGTSPQWGNNNVDMTQVGINYIINANGNATKPINDSKGINLGTIQQTFEENKNAILALDNSETSGVNLNTLNGSWPIYKSGYKIEPILYTQKASYDVNGNVTGFGYTSSITFVQGEQGPSSSLVSINDYTAYIPLKSGIPNVLNSFTLASYSYFPYTLEFSPPAPIGTSGSFNTSTNEYSPLGTPTNLKTKGYILNFLIYLEQETLSNIWVIFRLLKNGVSVASTQFKGFNGYTSQFTYQDRDAKTTDVYRVVASSIAQIPNTTLPNYMTLNKNSFIKITQYPNPGTGACNSPFWTTGSSADILLASTASVSSLNNYRGQKQKDINKSGFNPINLDFEPQVYDEIRFEGLEQLSFTITNITSSATNQMILNLDQEIPNGVNLDYFLLRRYVEDPSSIILDVNFPLPDNSGSINSAGNGILKPQYITQELESSIDTIVQNLKSQNLI